MAKVYVTWEQVEDFIASVIAKYKDQNLSGVYGLPRGGLIFAVMISNRMNIPMLSAPTENCLIVDDICDSGESLYHYVRNSSGEKVNYFIVTMFRKDNALGINPDFSMFEKGTDWIVFPWEEVKED